MSEPTPDNLRLLAHLVKEGTPVQNPAPLLAAGDELERLAKRLEMAEGLLRRAASFEDPLYLSLGRHQMFTTEAEYLRSLDGEGDS